MFLPACKAGQHEKQYKEGRSKHSSPPKTEFLWIYLKMDCRIGSGRRTDEKRKISRGAFTLRLVRNSHRLTGIGELQELDCNSRSFGVRRKTDSASVGVLGNGVLGVGVHCL